MKFTKSSVAALKLPPGKSDYFAWDDATPGFGIRLRGDKRTWTAQMRVAGRTQRLAIGDVRQIELDAARTAAKRFFAEATLGKDPATERAEARAKASNTFGSIAEKYIAARKTVVRPNTYRHLDRYLRRYFKQFHGMPIESVSRRDIVVAVDAIAAEHGRSSAAHARAVLSSFWTWALKEGLAGESNPVTFTNDPDPGAKPRDRVLNPAEIRAIWKALLDTEYGAVTKLVFWTGCRRSEIRSLEWNEIDFDKALLVIPGRKMKGHKEHRLPLVPEALELLRSIPRRDGNPFVFGGLLRGFTSYSYCHAALAASLAGEVTESWSLHDVRRTVRSELGDLEIEPWVGELILAHARSGIEGTYN